ncbi:MAG: divergent polysaccharide deacetylase family protein [Pseudomonadota bacterium]
MKRRRLKLPVISRLMQAWIALGTGACVFAGYLVFGDAPQPGETAIEITGLERFAMATGDAPGESSFDNRLTVPGQLTETGPQGRAVTPEVIAPAPTNGPRVINVARAPNEALRLANVGATSGNEPPSLATNDQQPINGPVSQSARRPQVASSRPGSLRDNDEPIQLDYNFEDDDTSGDIVITIDGSPALSPEEEALASVSRTRRQARNVVLASADTALSVDGEFGPIPSISSDGRKPATYYARPFEPQGNVPNLALIVGGLGLNRSLTERAIDELPPQITLAFAPYARDLEYWTARARSAGHEVLLELPMESGQGDDSALGPAALLSTRTEMENLQRLDWLLSRFQGYVGVTNYLGAKLSGDARAMSPILGKLRRAGLLYFDDTGSIRREAGSSYRDLVDVTRIIAPGLSGDGQKMLQDLASLERQSRNYGLALGKTYIQSSTFTQLSDWAWGLEERDFTMAPASAILALELERDAE